MKKVYTLPRYLVYKNNNRNKILVLTGLAIPALIISLYARWLPRLPGDLQITLLLQSFDGALLRSIMEWASSLFRGWWVALLVIGSGILVWRWLSWREGAIVGLAGICVLFQYPLKIIIEQPRPAPDLVQVLVAETWSGFPSGHAMSAVLILGMLSYIIAVFLPDRRLRLLALAILSILILLIGASRVYLGAHWASDVIGGYLIGGVFLTGLIWLYEILALRYPAENR